MTLEEARDMLSVALLKYAGDAFSMKDCLGASATPSYLEDFFGGPPAHLAGRVGKRFLTSLQLHLAGRLIVRYERGERGRWCFNIYRPQ